ncbi:Rap1-interacting factor 1 N-terminal [Penicillium brevicompactum]|uniref:Rap1-interacting factor 1 N-terminal n=1 Tax=Penicillium brevicompactum TaxID=5074 RepID=UPI002541484C|nr:Rap1-interacting factor 1 N-terminal [Penicillium brevicompactum]KAJ5327238.1 Rap1-interacting factor 1 N-terminal [Penicillium brevicompactum]
MVEIFSARPPTPPRTASRIADDNQIASPLTVSTPKTSSFESLESAPGTSSRSSKRVNFSPWPKFIKPPTFASASQSAGDIKIIPSTDSKPTKSILKTTQSPIPAWSPNVNIFTAESLAMLLESSITQLAGESTSSRLDAYMQFFNALRAYDGLPAGQEIGEKLKTITEFIQRDVKRDLTNAGIQDTNLANQALKLSATFIWHPQISAKIPEDFKIFLVEHSISSLHEAKAPKSVLAHYMAILHTQNFSPKVMTNARVTRILTILQDITKRISGNGILSNRLSVYQRLWVQAKPIFLSHPGLWMENLIGGMLHHVKDTRDKGIIFGFRIAAEVGPNAALSKSIREFFDRPLEHDRKIFAEIRERMTRMMTFTESGVHVPQIWSVIILLLRNKRWNMEHWHNYKEWLLVLQKCFNCSEPLIKAQAIIGWNRFVSVVGPEESTSRSLLKMLGKPILSQFDRRKTDKSASPPSQLALSSYYNLLYYTFRPSATPQHLDFIWEEYVLQPSSGIFSTVPALSDCLSRIISNLLWSTQPKIWTDRRIDDPSRMDTDELPSADCKWVRSRFASILKVFENLFKSSLWVDNAVATSNVALAWNSLCSALSLASSKEITPSGESMQAVAGVLSLLHRLWVAGPSSLNASNQDIFLDRFRYLSTTVIGSVGGISFTQKLLLSTADETFATVSTPTDRHRQLGTSPDSPILHLLRSISSAGWSVLPSQSYKDLVMGNVEAACKSKISRGSRLELLQKCAELSTAETGVISRALSLTELVWDATAQTASNTLGSFSIEPARERDGSVSRDYDNVIKILLSGLRFPAASQGWSDLLESFVRVIQTEKSNQLIATMIVEPIAEHTICLPVGETYLPTKALFGHSLSIPFLQGTGLGINPGGGQPPGHAAFPSKFLDSVSRTLRLAYDEFGASDSHALAEFIKALTSFLGSGVPQFQSQVLQYLQPSLCLWLKDELHKINVVDLGDSADSRIVTAYGSLTSAVVHVLQTSVLHDLPSLETFEYVLLAGFESSHNSTTKKFVDLWTLTFGSKDSYTYPSNILQAVESAESKIHSPILPLKNVAHDVQIFAPSPPKESTGRSAERLQPATRSLRSSELDCSPVMQAESSMVKEVEQETEPQLPNSFQSDITDAQYDNGTTASRKRRTRRQMFSMIESIQSSSPATTPRKLGFNTPPHLRRVQSGDSNSELLLTPVLAPTENEDGFFGSSPTPGTKEPTPSANSNAAAPAPQDIPTSQETDPPSSPPEPHSRSPSPQKNRARTARRRAAKARKALVGASGIQSTVNSPATSRLATENNTTSHDVDTANDHDNDKENADLTPRPNMDTPGRRLRSARGKDSEPSSVPSPAPTVDSPNRTPVQKPRNGKSTAGFSIKRQKNSPSCSAQELAPEPLEMSSDTRGDSVMDSSEETETQIASQLGLDLELAVVVEQRAQPEKEQPVEEHSLRKRKRDDEDKSQPSSTRTDRRRSTRLSTAKDSLHAEPLDLNGTPPRSPAISNVSQSASPIKSLSPTATRRSTRNSQRKRNSNSAPEAISDAQNSPLPNPTANDETPRPSKRSRKSVRLGGHDVSESIENEPQSASQDTGLRKTRSRQHAIESQSVPEPPIFHPPSEKMKQEPEIFADEDMDVEIVPEISMEEEHAAEQNTPPLSTEEATDSQISGNDRSIKFDQAQPEPTMDVDVDVEQSETQTGRDSVEATTKIATASIQTQEESSTLPRPEITQAGITQALRDVLGDLKLANLGPDALREVDDLLFNIRVEAHDASRRHNTSA